MERLLFYPTLMFNRAAAWLGWRRWYDHIDHRCTLGALPLPSMKRKLVEEEEVKGVISVVMSHELTPSISSSSWRREGVKHLHLPVKDFFHSPSLSQIHKALAFIQSESEGRVYIHCKVGRTRSATIMCCYLISHYNLTPKEATEWVKAKRNHIILRDKHLEIIREFYATTR